MEEQLESIELQLKWGEENLESPLDNLDTDDVKWLIEQAKKVERYEKALKEIASANNEISKASCPRIAKQELYK